MEGFDDEMAAEEDELNDDQDVDKKLELGSTEDSEGEGQLPDMNTKEMKAKGFYKVETCKVFVQSIFPLFSVQNPDICTPTENHDPSTVLDSVGISGSGISVVLHSWCFHHFLYNKTEFGSATASPEIARTDPEIVDF